MKKILSLLLSLSVLLTLSACGGTKIVWNDMLLGDALPEPPATKGDIIDNSSEELWLELNKISAKQFNDYIEACKDVGFTVDAETTSFSYDAYNEEGYKLGLSHYDSDSMMRIQLEIPMQMDTISWPIGSAGKQLPKPKSTIGKFSYEYDDSFFVYIGETSKTDYSEYVNACSEKGFNIDYNKGEGYYYADNAAGWNISVCYVGNSIMTIEIDAPDDEESKGPSNQSNPVSSQKEQSNSGLDPNFKAAMDSYENFMNEYVAFMKKYQSNPADLDLLSDYTDYMSKYADFVESFENWEDQEMSAVEAAYYVDVQARVSKKLLEVVS